MRESRRLVVRGLVQGVGFRPFVFRLADSLNLKGQVANSGQGVDILLEGEMAAIQEFLRRLRQKPPPRSRIESIVVEKIEPKGFTVFSVVASTVEGLETTPPPDLALCDDCRRELGDEHDRRKGYPLISCMNCGPRFSILISMPYDRSRTTMKSFRLCPACQREYSDPPNRRFHAEPISCWECGPRVWFVRNGEKIEEGNPIDLAAAEIDGGKTVAVKGMGGFHLAADATNEETIQELRSKKQRHRKPFAIMARDIAAIESVAFMNEEEEALLKSAVSPILLLKKRPKSPIAESVAPMLDEFGMMLPYTPIHTLLLGSTNSKFLVMTSGNPRDEVIIHDNRTAMEKLSNLTDSFLFHDRQIRNFADDSVVRIADNETLLIRRSRGFVPMPIDSPVDVDGVLAVGGDLKNTFAIGKGKRVFISQHIGDLESPSTREELIRNIRSLSTILNFAPNIVAHDMHPGYISTLMAESKWKNRLSVQHHHAHLVSALASNGSSEDSLGLACDGTGYAPEDQSWGFELFRFDLSQYNRIGHLRQFQLPGGDSAVLDPRRTAFSVLLDSIGSDAFHIELGFSKSFDEDLAEMMSARINSPLVSSCGRLFDAVSTILGICYTSSYEGEAAAELEAVSDSEEADSYPFEITANGSITLDYRPMIRALIQDLKEGERKERIGGKFHNSLCEGMVGMLEEAKSSQGIENVVLSGGCFVNKILFRKLTRMLVANGMRVYTSRAVPPNDGGLSFGQAIIAGKVR